MSTLETALIRDKAERMSRDQLVAEISRCERGIEVAANAAARRRFQMRQEIMQQEYHRRAMVNQEPRHSVKVDLVNLTAVEKDLVHTLVAVLTDPGLQAERLRIRAGELALTVDGDEVTWIDPTEAQRCAV